ncbi:MAG: M23 family metallopeptidase, partial [Gammaproteobacteria bacterium]|nr:M23 family metallopeptidase [Gammaproteobacteria bacterium]
DGVAYAVRKNVSGWDTVICIRHDECLSRYAHLTEASINIRQGWLVKKGQFLGSIGNAKGAYAYHLHFDIAKLNARMAMFPLDWPGKAPDALARVQRDYYSPVDYLREVI